MTTPPRGTLVLCLAAVYLIWGSSYLATRIGVLHLPPLLFAGVRFLASGVLLVGFATWRGFRFRSVRGEWHHLVVLGFAGVAFTNGLQVWAMQRLPSHTGALLNASCAFWIVAFGLFGRRAHRPTPLALAGIVIGFLGTALLVWPAGDEASRLEAPLLPQFAVLLGCVGWAAATIHLRNIHTRLDVFALTGLQMGIGGAMLSVLGLLRGEAGEFHYSPAGLAALGYLTVFSSCLAYTAYTWLARNASPAQTGTYGYVNPVIATVLGTLVLDERLGALQVVGSAVIVSGVALVNWPTRGTTTAADDAI